MYPDDIFILGPLAIDVTIDVGLQLKSHLMPTGLTICDRKFGLLFHRLQKATVLVDLHTHSGMRDG